MEQHLLGRTCISMMALAKKVFPLREMGIIHPIPPPARKGMMRWCSTCLMVLAEMGQVCSYRMNRKQNTSLMALRLQPVSMGRQGWFKNFTDLYRICLVGIEPTSWGCWGWEGLWLSDIPSWYWCSIHISFPLGSILKVPGCNKVPGLRFLCSSWRKCRNLCKILVHLNTQNIGVYL